MPFLLYLTHKKTNIHWLLLFFYSKNEINTKNYNDYVDRNLPIESKYDAEFDLKKKTHIVRVLSTGKLAELNKSDLSNNDDVDSDKEEN